MNNREKELLIREGVTSASKMCAEYRVIITGVSVKIRIYENTDGDYFYHQSHLIKTPLQAGPYQSNAISGENQEDALRLAVYALMTSYHAAVVKGHHPSREWLVPNEYFD